jgi:hypothetical protein
MKAGTPWNATLAILIITLAVGRVQASTVVYEDIRFVSTNTVFTKSFELDAAGPYKATLVDFEFPDPFAMLVLGVTQGDPLTGFTEHGILFGTGSFTFNVADTTKPLNVHLVANPDMQESGFSLYGLQILAVPIPPAFWLFLSGLTGIVTIARRNRETALV